MNSRLDNMQLHNNLSLNGQKNQDVVRRTTPLGQIN